MEALPATSEASVARGCWFVFPAGDHTIRAWGSAITGRERIYVDDAVVSEHRSVGRVSAHTFTVAGQNYVVAFKTISIIKGQLECTLLNDGKATRAYLTKYAGRKPLSALQLLLSSAAGAAIGLLTVFVKLPLWTLLGLFALVIAVIVKARTKGGFVVEEIV